MKTYYVLARLNTMDTIDRKTMLMLLQDSLNELHIDGQIDLMELRNED